MKYAIILSNLVENVILADSRPVIEGRTVVQLAANQAVGPGDSYDGSVFTPYVPSVAEILRRDAPARLRQSYTALRQWSIDAAAINTAGGTPTAAQVRALFDRFGKLCDGMADLLLNQALDQ